MFSVVQSELGDLSLFLFISLKHQVGASMWKQAGRALEHDFIGMTQRTFKHIFNVSSV